MAKKETALNPITAAEADIENYLGKKSSLDSQIAPLEKRYRELAIPAAEGVADAMKERATITTKLAAIRDGLAAYDEAIAQTRADIARLRADEHARTDKHLREQWLAKALTRDDRLKAIEKHARGLYEALPAFVALNAELHTQWNPAWGFAGPALTYPQQAGDVVAHLLCLLEREFKTKLPAPKYTQSGWKGLRETFKAANAWAKRQLFEPPADELEPIEQPTPPSVAAPPSEPTDIYADTLSGRAWTELQEATARRRPKHFDIDPFTGAPINVNEI